jgi:general L-amino acid transport system permease protein
LGQQNLFATPVRLDSDGRQLLTIAWFLPQILNWALFNAVWTGPDRSACLTTEQGGQLPAGWSGACWAFVNAKFGQFMVGRYPMDERWRVYLTAVLFVALLVPLLMPRAPFKR